MHDGATESIERAIADIKAGKAVVVVDDEDRENEGDLIFAAELATPELVSFMVRYTSGYICVPLTEAECDRLDLPPMYHTNGDQLPHRVHRDRRRQGRRRPPASRPPTGPTRCGCSPTRTATAADFVRPGHVLPLRAREGGVLRRPGHTEAAVDLARLAGLRPAGVLCEIVSQKEEGDMARADELRVFADEHDLALITIADLIAYRRRIEKHVVRVARATDPDPARRLHRLRLRLAARRHRAHRAGDAAAWRGGRPATARTCWCGCTRSASPATCSARCAATAARSSTRRSPRWPPRAAGWCSTCAGTRAGASACCTSCRPTSCRRRAPTPWTPTSRSGCPPTPATTASARRSSCDLGVRSMRLLTNNPDKRAGLEGYGLAVLGRVPLPVRASPQNLRYLRTKRDRMGHDLPDPRRRTGRRGRCGPTGSLGGGQHGRRERLPRRERAIAELTVQARRWHRARPASTARGR